MALYINPAMTILPEHSFGYQQHSPGMNLDPLNLDFHSLDNMVFPVGSLPSGSLPSASPATLAPATTPSLHPGASPTYVLGTPYSTATTSDSSSASSPDIQSLLPRRHSWPQTQPTVNASWYGLTPTFDGTTSTSTSPIAPWPLDVEADTSMKGVGHPSPVHPHHVARHHPYLSESSMASHRRALAAVASHHPGSMPFHPQTLHSAPTAHGVPHGAAVPIGTAGDAHSPPKSGRLGVKRRQKYTRTRTGCLGCRARRIKCDEGRPICRRCTVAKRECCFPDPNEAKGKRGAQSDSDDEQDLRLSNLDTGVSLAPQVTSAPAVMVSAHNAPERSPVAPPVSVSEHDSASDLAFELNQAIPEGFGIGGEPLGWERAFTEALSPNNLGFDLAAATGGDLAAVMTINQSKDKWASGDTPMLSTPNFLLPWFPTAQEQSLILHYCANAADLMMAIPQGLNPMLAINLPLALESPRGVNPAADALRVTLLGIGAVHQAFLLARSGGSTAQTTATFQYAANLRDMAKMMVRKATLEDPEAVRSDAALSAATSLATIDIFFGGDGWQDNFDVAKRIVAARGGPARMLKDSAPTQLSDNVTVTPTRLLLEILAIYESFGCLTLDEEPSLIAEHDTWWFEKSGSTYEDKSVETLFGMSKVMVHLFSRVSRLLARVSKLGRYLEEPRGAQRTHPDGLVHVDTMAGGLLPANVVPPIFQPQTKKSKDGARDMATLQTEAVNLERDIDAWIESLQVGALEHERVQVGNRAYAHAMKILLMRKVFGRGRDDADVQAAAQQVLQHCSISTAALGMSIDLMWPAVVAGCEVDGNSRQWLLTLLEGFKAQCCFDVETASRIIQETWRRVDNNLPRADWKGVCDDLGLKVLLC